MTDTNTLTPEERDRARRLKWFREARFGMFIHWGLYAQIGRHEWALNLERIPFDEYEKLADTWKPKKGCQRQWAKLAKATGMRYMVMTTKHHEGFCLWDSKVCDYNAANHGPGRDLVAEYVEACRSEGLRVGLYYSLQDWRHPDALKGLKDDKARGRFIDYTHGLVRELMTNYGKIDILWYDGPYPYLTPEQWESEKLNAMVRDLQPDIILNNRTRLPEDFGTPEQHITPEQEGRMWEACMTLNDSWGYTPIDTHYKSAWEVLGMLRQVAAGGGNLLLNIGPAPDGSIPPVYRKVFGQVGDWLRQYGTSIYEANDPMKQGWQITGAFTRKGNTAYYHCSRWPGREFAIGGVKSKALKVRLMNGPEVRFTQTNDRLVLHDIPANPPHPLVSVFEVEMKGVPEHYTSHSIADIPW